MMPLFERMENEDGETPSCAQQGHIGPNLPALNEPGPRQPLPPRRSVDSFGGELELDSGYGAVFAKYLSRSLQQRSREGSSGEDEPDAGYDFPMEYREELQAPEPYPSPLQASGSAEEALYAVTVLSPSPSHIQEPGPTVATSWRQSPAAAQREQQQPQQHRHHHHQQQQYKTLEGIEGDDWTINPRHHEANDVAFNSGYHCQDHPLPELPPPSPLYEVMPEEPAGVSRSAVAGMSPAFQYDDSLQLPPSMVGMGEYDALPPPESLYANVLQMRGGCNPQLGMAPQEGGTFTQGGPAPQPIYAPVLQRNRGALGAMQLQPMIPSEDWARQDSTA